MATANKSNEIHLTRVYDAPVSAVWDAWTDPAQAAKWWGPRGWSITTHSKDLHVGGHWSYTMNGPAGEVFENKTIYLEVEPRKKLVYDHGGNDDRPALFRVTVLFSELKNKKTKMDMTMTLATAEAAEQTKQRIKQANGNSTWDRLAEYLEEGASGKEKFVINRSFSAPLNLMFDMWTDPRHVAQWTAPTGFTMTFLEIEIKPGGEGFYVMTGSPGGNEVKMYGKTKYIEVTRPQRIVYTQQFCDENRKLARHPMAPTWPATMLTVVELTEEAPDQTRVTVTWEAHGSFTAEELDTFIAAKGGMTMGWTGSFEKLDAYLAATLM